MVCQMCNEYPATIHITEIINGNKKELHICSECGKKKGIVGKQISLSIGDLVGGIIEDKTVSKITELQEKKCDFCKMTFEKSRKIAKLGCIHDLDVFEEWYGPFIEKIHGAPQHVGKVPGSLAKESKQSIDTARLKKQLQEAIKAEDYEGAAKLRDQIKKLEL